MIQKAPMGKLVSILYRYGRAYLDQKMAVYAIGSGQYAFLYFLYDNDGASQDTISKALQIDKATTTRAIKKLEDTGLTRRTKDTMDGRVNHIHLTEKGLALKNELKHFSDQWSDVLTKDFSATELEMLHLLMQKLVHNATTHKKLSKKEVTHETQ